MDIPNPCFYPSFIFYRRYCGNLCKRVCLLISFEVVSAYLAWKDFIRGFYKSLPFSDFVFSVDRAAGTLCKAVENVP
jgi:hypothetical protein